MKPALLDPRAVDAYGLRPLVAALPRTIIVNAGGVALRVLEDGRLEEVNAVPRRWSISADPTARRVR